MTTRALREICKKVERRYRGSTFLPMAGEVLFFSESGRHIATYLVRVDVFSWRDDGTPVQGVK